MQRTRRVQSVVNLKIVENFFSLTSIAIGNVVTKMLDSGIVNASVDAIILEKDRNYTSWHTFLKYMSLVQHLDTVPSK